MDTCLQWSGALRFCFFYRSIPFTTDIMQKPAPKTVWISLALGGEAARALLEGMREGLRASGQSATEVHFHWLEREPPNRQPDSAAVTTPPFDSWIASLASEQWLAEWPPTWRDRVINLFHGSQVSQIPTVAVDDSRIGEDAARHFLAEGCTRAAIVCAAGDYGQQLRKEAFCATWRDTRETPAIIFSQNAPALQFALREWLQQKNGRAAVFVAHSLKIQSVIHALEIPARETAKPLLLVAHDTYPSQPPDEHQLAGCRLPLQAIGQALGHLLSRQWRGESLAHVHEKIPALWEWGPSGLATPAARLAVRAERLLRERLGEAGFSIEQLSDALAVPRRTLEHAFRERFGNSPSAFLQSLRLETATDLLKNSSLRIVEVAERCGFATQHHFSYTFKRKFAMSPRDFRRLSG
jgi:AraC-like DNA-binding protein